jgi:hypothetical protein
VFGVIVVALVMRFPEGVMSIFAKRRRSAPHASHSRGEQ